MVYVFFSVRQHRLTPGWLGGWVGGLVGWHVCLDSFFPSSPFLLPSSFSFSSLLLFFLFYLILLLALLALLLSLLLLLLCSMGMSVRVCGSMSAIPCQPKSYRAAGMLTPAMLHSHLVRRHALFGTVASPHLLGPKGLGCGVRRSHRPRRQELRAPHPGWHRRHHRRLVHQVLRPVVRALQATSTGQPPAPYPLFDSR